MYATGETRSVLDLCAAATQQDARPVLALGPGMVLNGQQVPCNLHPV